MGRKPYPLAYAERFGNPPVATITVQNDLYAAMRGRWVQALAADDGGGGESEMAEINDLHFR